VGEGSHAERDRRDDCQLGPCLVSVARQSFALRVRVRTAILRARCTVEVHTYLALPRAEVRKILDPISLQIIR
jgi:hypothetical protein